MPSFVNPEIVSHIPKKRARHKAALNVCAIPACPSPEDISYYTFPKEEESRKKWIQACYCENLPNIDSAVICENHFSPENYDKHLQLFHNSPARKRLKEGAVPNLNLPHRNDLVQITGSTASRVSLQNGKDDHPVEKSQNKIIGNRENPDSLSLTSEILIQSSRSLERKWNSEKSFASLLSRQAKLLLSLYYRKNLLCNYLDLGTQPSQDLETEVNNVRNELYAGFKPTLKELPPIEDIDNVSIQNGAKSPMEVARSSSSQPNLPPMGEFQYTSLESGEKIYAMRGNVLNVWREGIIVEVERKLSTNGNGIILTHSGIDITYKLRFDGGVKNRPLQTKTLTPRQVAYHKPSNVRLLVGTRVIAIYQDDSYLYKKGEFYSGVIAEPPKVMNKYRYLIFFDDGYASYVHHDNVRPVTCQTTPNVWEDVHSNSREFIKQYLSQYPERPMVKLSVDQAVWTEWDGKWCSTKVIAVDASLVKLHFKETGRLEWVYRGSTRLSPLFREMQQQKMRKEGLISVRRQNFTSGRKNTPYVEYTRQMDENSQNSSNSSSTVKRAVARKSTAPKKIDIELPPTPTIKWESEGEIFKVVLPEVIASPRKYFSHTCNPDCLLEENKYDEEVHLKNNNVLIIPIILGWERQLTKHKNLGCRKIFYIAPCGRRLRNMDELHTYLSTTKSTLELDFFTYDWWVHVYNEFKTSKVLCKIEDISYGKENVPISCVNSLDNNYPEYVEYSTKRIPQSSVNLNLDDEFLEGCDCEDDCRDKSKCNCWKLTLQSSDDFVESKHHPFNVGYVNRRLPDVVSTGIYECNSKCKCSKTCGNRVAQNPLRCKLQVFKTERRGWGIRTLHDIPQGGFVCVYVGNLYDNEEANKLGQDFGDEYFAELDMIEAVERRKEGYESDCGEDDEAENKENPEAISDFSGSNDDEVSVDDDEIEHLDDERDTTVKLKNVVPDFPKTDRPMRSLRKKTKVRGDTEEITVDENEINTTADQNGNRERAVLGFDASVVETSPKPKYVSTRKYFGKNEDVYIMDAKTIGNVGRYLNHSCNPNIFVQNCFVDTHDLRYPWIAFFASSFIRAGTELCWDYCYIVDQVEGKEIYCECGASNCRGRLL
uniref:Histone-lysine N-methyltransferase eggless n=1 Tax=Lepeophtheirus salmonis TaxID=72036 RepID=A0A0K2T695_LEPSM